MTTVTLLHPGAMGASIGSALTQNGHTVLWVSKERSQTTKQRAADAGLEESEFRTALNRAEVVISVTPPGVAVSVAADVADEGFDGVYVDMNAVAPQSATQMAALFPQFVDGGIVGPPAWERGTTRLGLSGPRTAEVESLFAGSTIETIDLGPEIGKASAFKVSFAAWTKGSGALLLLVCAYARSQGVESELFQEWERRGMGMETKSTTVAQQMGPKSWRFGDEMREISDAVEAAGLGTGLFKHAGETFDRLAHLKNATDRPLTLEEVTRDLLDAPPAQ
ncbi:MAG TPA: NAD(P)-dependent oxidoreductase [Acidimicrobiia bacterium]|jgi:3-hydroxyisobutyrate dehydrogenase-like beta-hydroxyacid dehydrogenase|nr:NAD(P)-dependent oxidoreductase [Acidimicrobiia bacterium]HIL05961.1 NAD(P)-dependent oxidoreductase [Acidimicrobiia bacterium]